MNKLIIGLIIGLIMGILFGYFSYGIFNKPVHDFPLGGAFEIREELKNETTAFFEANPSDSEIENYCKNNQLNCRYYCTEINPQNNICNAIAVSPNMKR